MLRRIVLVLASLLAVAALASGGWLLDPAGSRSPDGRPQVRANPMMSGTALYTEITRRMVAERTTTYTFSGSSGGGEPQSGSGVLQFLPSGDPARTFRADVTVNSRSGGRVRAVLLPEEFFLALPPAKGLPRSKPWLKVGPEPESALGKQLSPLAHQVRSSVDPGQCIGLLLATGLVEEVGTDTVERVATTEHRAIVDLRRAVRLVENPAWRQEYRAMLDAGVRWLEYAVWLDSEGLPRRVEVDVPGEHGIFSLTGVYSRWGERVKIAAPKAREVFDADTIGAQPDKRRRSRTGKS